MISWLTGIPIVVMPGAVTAAAALAWYDGERLRAELEAAPDARLASR